MQLEKTYLSSLGLLEPLFIVFDFLIRLGSAFRIYPRFDLESLNLGELIELNR